MKSPQTDTLNALLGVVADLLRGDRHSRRTIAKATGKSLPTADRWIEHLLKALPGIRRIREGKTTWLLHEGRHPPSASAAAGACVAASLGAIFDGSQQERNLKDARDYILRERGESYGDLDRKFVLAGHRREDALPEHGAMLERILDGVLRSRRTRVAYRHNDGRLEHLLIEPLSLVTYEGRFYVLIERDGGIYPFRFARFAEVETTEESFQYPSKGQYEPRALLKQSFGIHIHGMGPPQTIELLLTGSWATYALTHRWHPSQRVTPNDGGGVRIILDVPLCREVETWILGLGDCAKVVQPEQLRQAIGRRLRDAATFYETRSIPPLAKTRPRQGRSRKASGADG